MFLILWKKSKFFIFDHVKNQNWPYLAKTEKRPSKFFIFVQCMGNYQKFDRKLKKYWGQMDSFLPWTQNLKWIPRPSFCNQVKNSCVL